MTGVIIIFVTAVVVIGGIQWWERCIDRRVEQNHRRIRDELDEIWSRIEQLKDQPPDFSYDGDPVVYRNGL